MDAKFGIGTFSNQESDKFVGLVFGDKLIALDALAKLSAGSPRQFPSSVLKLLENWDQYFPVICEVVSNAKVPKANWLQLNKVKVHPPVDLPRQVFCTGANYRQHVIDLTIDMGVGPEGLEGAELRRWAEEMMDKRAATGEPYVFTKPVSAIAGAYDPIVIPSTTEKLDWELELGVIIGKPGFDIPAHEAMSHVAGYAIVNDLSARDLIARTDYKMIGTDWLRSKGQPGFLPFGPYVLPAKFLPNPLSVKLELTVSGQVMQNEVASDMLFGIERQIEYLSKYVKLLPGDLICTGSPAGNGTHYNRFLRVGDRMVGRIDGLGMQIAECIDKGKA